MRDRLYQEDSAGQTACGASVGMGSTPYQNVGSTPYPNGNIPGEQQHKQIAVERQYASCANQRSMRALIEERIMYHNRMASGLNALLRAIPQDINYAADRALAQLLVDTKPSEEVL